MDVLRLADAHSSLSLAKLNPPIIRALCVQASVRCMESIMLEATHKNYRFRIEEDLPDIGFYLYVFQNDNCIYDSLQDDLETLKEIANEKFNCPLDEWKATTST